MITSIKTGGKTPKLSLLICSLVERKSQLNFLLDILCPQVCKYENDIEILINTDSREKPIGKKRNELIDQSIGKFIAFLDDDDAISSDYIELIMDAIKEDPEVIGIIGVMTTNGKNPRTFIHSNRYDSWFEKDNVYFRNNNHLNPIKSKYAKMVRFPEKNHGEDSDYSSNLLPILKDKKEFFIDSPIYFYQFKR